MTFRKRLLVAFSTVIVVPLLLFTIAFIALGNYLIGEKGELQGYTSIVGGYDEYDGEEEYYGDGYEEYEDDGDWEELK